MINVNYDVSESIQRAKLLRERKIKHKLIISRSTVLIKTKLNETLYTSSPIPFNELHLIKKFKKEIECSPVHPLFFEKYNRKANFFAFSPKIEPGKYYYNLLEVDLTSAYWFAAKVFNYISQETYDNYNDHSKCSKLTKLASIGSLARRRKIYEYEDDGLPIMHINKYGVSVPYIREEPKQENLDKWTNITSFVDYLMYDIFKELGSNALFYWVDAVFFKENKIELVKKFLGSTPHKYKVLEWLYMDDGVIYVKTKGSEKLRTFIIPKLINENLLINGF